MALPVKEKTWLYNVNQTAGLSLGQTPDNQDLVFKIKQTLTGFATNPWTVWGSSDSVSVDSGGGTDYWVDSGDLIWSTGAHSWIVLKQAALGANFSICLDLYNTHYIWNLVVSPTAGFTGGTTSTRPTATDEVVIGSYNGGFNGAFTGKLHMWQSSDGVCTRWVYLRGGSTYAFGIFDKPKSPIAAWTSPSISGFQGHYSTTSHCTYARWNDAANLNGRISSAFSLYATCEGWISASGGENLASPDEDTAEWPIMPMGLASATAGLRGVRKGTVYDLWWGPTALNNGDTFPDDTSKQFVVFDDMIFPWNGSTPLIA